MKKIIIFFIQYYKTQISPYRANRCKFVPSCSSYALEAVQVHGALKGSFLSIKRILKCHPFRSFGIDEVPPKRK